MTFLLVVQVGLLVILKFFLFDSNSNVESDLEPCSIFEKHEACIPLCTSLTVKDNSFVRSGEHRRRKKYGNQAHWQELQKVFTSLKTAFPAVLLNPSV